MRFYGVLPSKWVCLRVSSLGLITSQRWRGGEHKGGCKADDIVSLLAIPGSHAPSQAGVT